MINSNATTSNDPASAAGAASGPAASAKPSAPVFRPFRSLTDVQEEPEWIWQGFLAEGALTLLAGHPFKGKSMLVGGLLRALASGESFLGRMTNKVSALLVTEEDDSVLRQRAKLFGLLDIEGGFLSRSSGSSRHVWPELVTLATEQAVMDGHSVLIFDTFSGLAQLGDEQENDAGAISERLRPLQTAASFGLAVLFLHHMNANGQPRGSGALRGISDIVVRLHREPGNGLHLDVDSRYPTGTPSRIGGRLIQGPAVWSYEATSPGGDAERSRVDETDALLRSALVDAGARGGLTLDQLAALPNVTRSKARRRLIAWQKDPSDPVTCTGAGVKGDPLRWTLSV